MAPTKQLRNRNPFAQLHGRLALLQPSHSEHHALFRLYPTLCQPEYLCCMFQPLLVLFRTATLILAEASSSPYSLLGFFGH